ncbi:hypothetical protein [Cyanobium sp. Morenito 9A2]|uniref:hypothetical protein n=1 Tax=Cyanobium sp. Morenito 9A2 TaxID=2823718 RepID=UPI0020CF7173|nr:hypothetical protein [Cyanobium sp. Morenito 9A2]MCP9848955.1 hypothetical protein [Cyanobium sp. Morenito 9A2]
MAPHPQSPQGRGPLPPQVDPDDCAVDRGRPLGLRLLALVGALSFVMLGISSLMPIFQPSPPPPLPGATKGAVG